MPQSTSVHDYIIRLKADSSTSRQTVERLRALEERFEKLRAEIKRLLGDTSGLSSGLKRFDSAADRTARNTKDLRRAVSDTASEIEQMQRAVKDADNTLQGADGMADYARRLRAMREQAQVYGDVESRTRAITGAIGYIGGGVGAGFERTANVGAEVLGAIEGVKLLKLEFPALREQLLGSGKATRAAVSALQQFVPGMSAASAETAVMVGSLGAIAAAGIAVSAALGKFKDVLNDNAQAIEDYMDISQEYADIIATGTTEDVLNAIEANRERNAAIDVERQALLELLDAYEEVKNGSDFATYALLELNEKASALGNTLGMDIASIDDVRERLEELNREYQNNVALESKLVSALSEGATAAADMKAREEELAQQRIEASQALVAQLDREMQYRVQLMQREQTWTRDQVQARLDAIDIQRKALEEEQQALEFYNEEIGISAEVYQAKTQQIADAIASLDREANDLQTSVIAAIDAREKENAALERLKSFLELTAQATDDVASGVGAVGDAFRQTAAAVRAATALQESYAEKTAETEEERNLTLVREAEDWALKQTKALAEHYSDLAKLDRDYYEKRQSALEAIAEVDEDANAARVEALQAYNKEDLRRTEDHLLRLAEIERDTREQVRDAAASLDARAVIAAQRQGKKQLDDENRKYALEKKRRAEDFKDQLKALEAQRKERLEAARQALEDLRRQHEEERRERIADFRRQQQEAAIERSIKLQRQREDWAREDALRRQQFQQELAALNVYQNQRQSSELLHFATLRNIASAGMSAVQQTFLAALNNIRNQAAGSGSGIAVYGAGAGGSPGYRGGFSSFGGRFAAGGWPPSGRDVLVGERGAEVARFYGGPWKIFASGQRPPNESLTINVPITVNADGARVGALADMQQQVHLEGAIRRGVMRGLAEVFGGEL